MATVRNSSDIFDIDFIGSGSHHTFSGSQITIPTNPLTDSTGTIFPWLSPQVFTIGGNSALVVPEVELVAFASYFTGVGTISSNISQTRQVTVTGDDYTVDMSNVRSIGRATRIYVYDTTAIPAPFTVVFTGGIIGIGPWPVGDDDEPPSG